ncbi:hypothetical protein DFP72DRAFT_1063976 [Ephemerocybe angulata]|uniref:Uncharacterized protein n=1 Tax=Ephemerocybe angulata TaxID=980116 RepID=A0A8H6MD40_9AGAR|nr:hypothetical protein DFP72DRAFT_1063976 [Tulosesus angulatus]
MNFLYKSDEAKLWLDSYTQKSLQEAVTPNNRCIDLLDVNNCTAVQYSEPPCVRLTKEIDGEVEEVTVRVAGILCSKILPPVLGLRSTKPEHVRYVRQFVRCSGLGSHAFAGQRVIFEQVYAAFVANPCVEQLDDFEFGLYEGHKCVDLHARHLTERRYVPSLPHIPFTPDIDPNHALEIARDTMFIRVEDNVVQYSKKIYEDDGSYSYEPLHPEEFKEGDVVEAVGTFVAFPKGKEGQYCMVFCLRGLTMLTSVFREDSRIVPNPILNVQRIEKREVRKKKRVKAPTAQALKRSFIQYGKRVEAHRKADSSMGGRDPIKDGGESRMEE